MSLSLIGRATQIIRQNKTAGKPPAPPVAAQRSGRLTRKTRILALAAHIGHAGAKSRLGHTKWSA
jgi:hypothetical protein